MWLGTPQICGEFLIEYQHGRLTEDAGWPKYAFNFYSEPAGWLDCLSFIA